MRTLADVLGGRDVFTLRPEQSVSEAAEFLAAKNIGAVSVVSADKLVGILSERDIIGRVVAKGVDPKKTTVEATMTKNPVTLDAAETPRRALELMQERKVRHLPVVHAGKLVGMISLRDLLQVQISTQQNELKLLSALPEREFE